MAEQAFTIENAEEFQRKLEALQRELGGFHDEAQNELEKAMGRLLIMLGGVMSVYPPPPPGSAYRRTDTLGRLWTAALPQFKASGNLFEGRIGNATPYGPWVQSEEMQVGGHRGRWQTDKKVVGDNMGAVETELERVGGTLVTGIADEVNAA